MTRSQTLRLEHEPGKSRLEPQLAAIEQQSTTNYYGLQNSVRNTHSSTESLAKHPIA